MKYTTTGERFFFKIKEVLADLELGWEILTNIKSDGGCTYKPQTDVGEGIGEEFMYINYGTARTYVHTFWQSLIYSQRGNVMQMFVLVTDCNSELN
jgi:hypothetical protein